MVDPLSTSIDGPIGSILVRFGEANRDQRSLCHRLGAFAFGHPLSDADFIEREDFMSDLALARGAGWRVWCVYAANDPNLVLATCKTIRRDLLVKDTERVHERVGYCIASVVTHSDYRGLGLASFLLGGVAQWLDGPGGAAVSMLYSNKKGLYLRSGWIPVPAPEISLAVGSFSMVDWDHMRLPKTRALPEEDISQLCARDVEELRSEIDQREVPEGHTVMAVLPTADLISWLHGRAEFMGLKINGEAPQNKGALCDENTWMFWHHDFRKQCLYIQRIRSFVQDSERRTKALAALLLCACQEAKAWKLPTVVTWDTNPHIRTALDIFTAANGVDIIVTEKRRETLSLRGEGSIETENLVVYLNEHFAWN